MPETAEGDWRAGLEHWAAMRDCLLTHLWAVPLVAAHGPPVTPNQLAWLDQCLSVLAGTRLGHGEKIAVSLLISGQVRSELSILSLLHQDPDGPARRMAGYGNFLRRVTESGRLPALREAVTDGAFDDLDATRRPRPTPSTTSPSDSRGRWTGWRRTWGSKGAVSLKRLFTGVDWKPSSATTSFSPPLGSTGLTCTRRGDRCRPGTPRKSATATWSRAT
ncbi:TetR/AcrR family transcriptional regulator C-terminal domain-containing protein [Streptomyces sp. NPDC057148]|uniref:TetR/AcrR family transcriptional regulator C-terminal domain-containing protein n=1 Tax=unclassified Streptomyces TaxID=2593676 RepID=UPI00363283B2